MDHAVSIRRQPRGPCATSACPPSTRPSCESTTAPRGSSAQHTYGSTDDRGSPSNARRRRSVTCPADRVRHERRRRSVRGRHRRQSLCCAVDRRQVGRDFHRAASRTSCAGCATTACSTGTSALGRRAEAPAANRSGPAFGCWEQRRPHSGASCVQSGSSSAAAPTPHGDATVETDGMGAAGSARATRLCCEADAAAGPTRRSLIASDVLERRGAARDVDGSRGP
jgi:hypothetical protein